MIRPVRMTHIKASKALSNWIGIHERPRVYLHDLIGSSDDALEIKRMIYRKGFLYPLKPDVVAACIEVVESRRTLR